MTKRRQLGWCELNNNIGDLCDLTALLLVFCVFFGLNAGLWSLNCCPTLMFLRWYLQPYSRHSSIHLTYASIRNGLLQQKGITSPTKFYKVRSQTLIEGSSDRQIHTIFHLGCFERLQAGNASKYTQYAQDQSAKMQSKTLSNAMLLSLSKPNVARPCITVQEPVGRRRYMPAHSAAWRLPSSEKAQSRPPSHH